MVFPMIQHTRNIKSAIVYKIIPFFTGLSCFICAMDLLGWINVFLIYEVRVNQEVNIGSLAQLVSAAGS